MSIFKTIKCEAEHPDGDKALFVMVMAVGCCASIIKLIKDDGCILFQYHTGVTPDEAHLSWYEMDTERDAADCPEQEFHNLWTEMIKHNALMLPASETKTTLNSVAR